MKGSYFWQKLQDFLVLLVKWVSALLLRKKWRHAFREWGQVYLDYLFKWRKIKDFNQKKNRCANNSSYLVLVVFNELTVTGAPLVALSEVKAFLKDGACVFVVAFKGGPLLEELNKMGVECLVSIACHRFKSMIRPLAEGCDLIILNTMMFGGWVNALSQDAPIMWYIHESQGIPKHLEDCPEFGPALNKCLQIFMVSQHAQSYLPDHIKSQVLHLGIADKDGGLKSLNQNKILRLAVVGTYVENKNQTLMVTALEKLNEDELGQVELLFIGQCEGDYYNELKKNCPPHLPIKFSGKIIDQDEKYLLYNTIDVFCVPSKDESCSLVVLEACMLGKPIIISDQVGAKYILEEAKCGLIFDNDNATDLAQTIKWLLANREHLPPMGQKARKAYEEKGTLEMFENFFLKITALIKDSSKIP